MLHDVAKKTWKFHLAIPPRRSQDTVLRSLLNDLLGCELQERFEGWQPGSLIPNTYIYLPIGPVLTTEGYVLNILK